MPPKALPASPRTGPSPGRGPRSWISPRPDRPWPRPATPCPAVPSSALDQQQQGASPGPGPAATPSTAAAQIEAEQSVPAGRRTRDRPVPAGWPAPCNRWLAERASARPPPARRGSRGRRPEAGAGRNRAARRSRNRRRKAQAHPPSRRPTRRIVQRSVLVREATAGRRPPHWTASFTVLRDGLLRARRRTGARRSADGAHAAEANQHHRPTRRLGNGRRNPGGK